MTLAKLVTVHVGCGGTQATEQAADQEHHLTVRRIIAVDHRFLDVLVPPLAEMADSRVLEQELAKPLVGRDQGADLDPDRRAVHGGVLVVGFRRGRDGLLDGIVFTRHPLEYVVGRTIHEDQLRLLTLQGEGDRLELGGELRQRADEVQRKPRGWEGIGRRRERLERNG